MRRTAAALLIAPLLLTACSKTPAPPPDARVDVPSVTDTQSAADQPTTSSGWNDRSLILIREEKFAEAVEAAQVALKLDPGNSAAYFNLGRALLGANKPHEAVSAFQQASRLTGESNTDVEWFLGRALALSGNAAQAEEVFERALAKFPDDKEIRASLDALLERKVQAADSVYHVDVDQDGATDDIFVLGETATVMTERGTWEIDLGPSPVMIKAYDVPDGPPLLIFSLGGCPSVMLRWDPTAKTVRREKTDIPCSLWSFGADGKIVVTTRHAPWVDTYQIRWQGGSFVTGDTVHRMLMSNDGVNGGNLGWVLDETLGGRAEGLNKLFASVEDYLRVQEMGLTAGREERVDQNIVLVELTEGGQVRAVLTFSESEHLITSVEWR